MCEAAVEGRDMLEQAMRGVDRERNIDESYRPSVFSLVNQQYMDPRNKLKCITAS